MSIISWIFFLSTFMIISCEKSYRLENIYGVWKGEYFGKELIIQFDSDGKSELILRDNDSNLIETINGNFVIDFSKKPIPLSIMNIPQLSHSLHTIIEIIGVDSIKLAIFSPHNKFRALLFEQKNSINLKRIN